MGGFTQILLKDTSRQSIDTQNARLALAKVPTAYRFYSEADIIHEYEAFKVYDGDFPFHQFPRHKINSLDDFKKYWSSDALGDIFVPPIGALQFDCYFSRTPKATLKKLGTYVTDNISEFAKFKGSFETFAERGMTRAQRKIVTTSPVWK